MDTEIQKTIESQFRKLPEDVQFSIVSADYQTKLQEITKRQRLLIDQAAKLSLETTLVMIGLEPLRDYVANLERELGIPTERAKTIATDVSENIFKPIRESLRSMNQKMESVETESGDMGTIVADRPSLEWGSTNTNDPNLNRDQILSEIENPSIIGKNKQTVPFENVSREIETLDEIPYQQDIKVKAPQIQIKTEKPNLFETKLADMTITSQQIVDATPTVKLPAVEKKRPFGGIDPYREEIK